MHFLIIFSIVLFLNLVSNCVAQSVKSDGLHAMRLFTTPEQREEIERLRHLSPEERKEEQIVEEIEVQDIDLTDVHFNGIVMRHNGSATIWINGTQQEYGTGYRVIQKRLTPALTLPMEFVTSVDQLQQAELKPGQVWQANKQKIQENFQLNHR